jgi:glycosyltransferase involved in cell wall biosynthesis
MVGGDGKNVLLNGSKGLVFPVLWHEPFGLAIIESLFFGCPVFGTPYGALPELLGGRMHEAAHSGGQVEALYSEFGRLSIKKSELVEAIKSADDFDRNRCRQYVADNFSAARMAADYLKLYEKVLNGQDLHAQAPTLETAPESKLLPLEP